jgi:dihydrofolate synthase / folylpolyglutamate synthase
MNYDQTLEFLYSRLPAYHRIGKAAYKSDLGNTLALDEYLGHSHTKFRTIHVGGTNGKGSVSHMIASVLMEAGYKTGLYTSPHLKDFRERIRVNGKMIPRGVVTGFVKQHEKFISALEPSFFEMTVALAFSYFAECGVDVAVIEVGLGGRLDSTNIINPVLSVITNIGHDHMDLLGDTMEKIAAEKAGIIKDKISVVISETQDEVKSVFLSRAKRSGSRISFADQNYLCELAEFDILKGRRNFFVKELSDDSSFEGSTPLGGDYQSANIQAVFQSFKVLTGTFSFTRKNILTGIGKVTANTGLMGRWQILDRKPLIICDTGHNKEGLEYVISQMVKIPATRLRIVLGFVSDKDLRSVLPLFPADAVYYFTRAAVPRALDEKTLKREAGRFGLRGDSFPDVKTALHAARSDAAATDLIFIGGSTFIVAEAV